MTEKRGIKNNNPGNIRKIGNWRAWQGIAPDEQQMDADFIVFKAPVWGIRAIAGTLITYYDKRLAADGSKIDTIGEIIDRWAPAADKNNTSAYASDVENRTGHAALDSLNLHDYTDMRPLVEAIVWHENGQQPYSSSQIDQALQLAGIAKPTPAVFSNPKVTGPAIAATATVAAQTVGQVQSIWDSLNAMGIGANIVFGLLGVLAIGGLLYAAYDIWKSHRAMA